ncbi:MAG: glycosyltransferase [bacterium]|nr:glycosyltransferase [bacterium]
MLNDTSQDGPAPYVSVVIPTFKEPECVRKAILSLFGQDLDKSRYEVIVVDSSPDDRVAALVTELQAEAPCALRLLTKHAEGPGPSRNLGASQARGDILALMDSDCEATPHWLEHGLAAFADGVGLVQGRTLPEPGVPLGIFTWYVNVEGENHVYECANIFYRRCAFEQAGGFDMAYNDASDRVRGGEDVDLAWTVKRNGWKSRFCHDALMYHEVQPMSIARWIYVKPLFIWPLLARRHPELRRAFFARYFFDRHQACIVLALIGLLLALATPLALVMCVPYIASRGVEPTRTLRGPLRLLRVAAYALHDLTSLAVFIAASVRFRSLLL